MRWLVFAAKNVLRNKRRSAVTVLITAIGTAAILTASGFGLYTYESLRERTAREVGHLVLAHEHYFDAEEEAPLAHGLTDHAALRTRLRQMEGVRYAIPRLELSGLISNGDKSEVFIGTGVDARVEFRISGPFLSVTDGRILDPQAATDADAEVMLGEGLAASMHAEVGSELTLLVTTADGALNGIDVRVVGILSTGKPQLDQRKLLLDLRRAQALMVTDKVSTLAAYLRDTEQTDPLGAELAAALPGLAIKTWEDLATYYLKVRALYDRIFGTLGIIILLMVFFAVTNTLSMAVVERTREIGTLAALGTAPGQLMRNFMLEAAVLGFGGTALGTLVAGATALALPQLGVAMPPPPGMTAGYPLVINFSPAVALVASASLVAASVVAAWIAARRGARMPIVEALAHV